MLEAKKGGDVSQHRGGGAGLWHSKGDQRQVIPRFGVGRRSNKGTLLKKREG